MAQDTALRKFTSSNGLRRVLVCMNHSPPSAVFLPTVMPGVLASSASWCGGGALMTCAWFVVR